MRLALLPLLLCIFATASAATRNFDVVVYGASEGGVMAAVAAARSGASVALIARGRFFGGLLGGGQPYIEPEDRARIGGLAREYFTRLGKYYGTEVAWAAEPHVAEGVLREMLRESGVEMIREERLRDVNSVRRKGRRIRRIITDGGEVLEAAVYIDATYEGDLLAASGVPFELPGEESVPQPDNYSFVICASHEKNSAAIPQPADYAPERYQPWLDFIEDLETTLGRPAEWKDLLKIQPLPNGKYAFTISSGSTGTPYIEADAALRAAIWQNHINYTTGLYYFLAHDEQVPEPVLSGFAGFGLCEDEFLFTNRWPHQLRIRVGRRMAGDFVLSWREAGVEQHDSIAASHFRDEPLQVPYRVLLPPARRLRNLLVVHCPSAGEAVTRTLRSTAATMALGHAAGLAAKLAIDSDSGVQDIDVAELTRLLDSQNAIRR